MPDYSALRLPLSERLPIVTYTNLVWPVAQTVWMSPQVERLTGYRLDEWVNRPGFFESILHPDDRDAVLAEMLGSRRELRAFSADYRLVARGGGAVWIHDESVPILDQLGQPELIQGYFIDVTGRKQLEQQLVHSQKTEALGRLAGEIAHDFNNHLMVIRAEAELLGRRLPCDSEEHSMVRAIIETAERAARLTRRLLTFARRQPLEPKNVAVDDVVRELGSMLEQIAGDSVRVVLDLKPTPIVRVDVDQLEQVVVNLVGNARDAMPTGGRVTVRTFTSRGGAVLSVSDTGVGMDAETQQRVFEPFFSTKDRDHGTGLGLSIVDGVVRDSGGSIEIDSTVGRGTAVRILLPASG
jgi:two-component system, cell cycle sensor histidine kinase and response regulator CckA